MLPYVKRKEKELSDWESLPSSQGSIPKNYKIKSQNLLILPEKQLRVY